MVAPPSALINIFLVRVGYHVVAFKWGCELGLVTFWREAIEALFTLVAAKEWK